MRESEAYQTLFNVARSAPRKPGVYDIVCCVIGKHYVGGTTNLRSRLKEHLYAITRQVNDHPISDDARKYGLEHISLSILEVCHSPNEIIEAEKLWQEKFDSVAHGYNRIYGNRVSNHAWRKIE